MRLHVVHARDTTKNLHKRADSKRVEYINTFRSSAARIVSTVCCKVVSSTKASHAPGCGMDAMKASTELKSRRKDEVLLLVCNNIGVCKKKGIGKCEINKVRCMHIGYERATSIHHSRASKISSFLSVLLCLCSIVDNHGSNLANVLCQLLTAFA